METLLLLPWGERKIEDISGAMYLYYTITILQNNKTLFEAHTHDFPKVQELPGVIDYILGLDMDNEYLMEDIKYDGFKRQVRYAQYTLEDNFKFDLEYFFKIERYDYLVKPMNTKQLNKRSEYVINIGQSEVSKEFGGDNREDYGKAIFIKHLTNEDLLAIKQTAEAFCTEAVLSYNEEVDDWNQDEE